MISCASSGSTAESSNRCGKLFLVLVPTSFLLGPAHTTRRLTLNSAWQRTASQGRHTPFELSAKLYITSSWCHMDDSMFANGTVGRFGQSMVAEIRGQGEEPSPGPGHYTTERRLLQVPSQGMTAGGKGKVFLSASPRFKNGDAGSRRAPGPAYYNPRNADPRSFHLNLVRRWI